MHVKGLEDQMHINTQTPTCVIVFGWRLKAWSPPLISPGFFWGWRPVGVVCVANRAKAEGFGQGASLLKGSCNFHSRVLLKLVLRPLPHLNTFFPSCSVRPSTPQLPPCFAAAATWLTVPAQTISFTPVICSGRGWHSVGLFVWALIFQTTCTQQTRIFCLLKNIDYRCGYGVYFFYAYY